MSLDKARMLISQRQFQEAINVLKEHLTANPEDTEAQALIGDAQERMMLQMQISGKLTKVEEQITASDFAGAKATLDGIRAIDPDNPKVAGLMDKIAQAEGGTGPMAAVPDPGGLEPAPLEPAPLEPAPMPDADSTVMLSATDIPSPEPLAPEPMEPAPLEPAPLEPTPLEPAPLEPAPLDPAPMDADATMMMPPGEAPLEPAPLDPAPMDAAPLEPAPLDAAPLEPMQPLDAAPLEPAPLEPAPMEPMQPLDSAGADADATMMMPPAGGGMEPLAPMEPMQPLDAAPAGDAGGTPPAMEALPSLEAVEPAPLEPMAAPAAAPGDDLIPLEPVSADSGGAPDLSHLDPAEAQRVMQYLEEGQKAFDRGDTNEAVDIWTRIFILDEDNQEAQRRIDMAQAQDQGGGEDQDMLLASGIAAFNDGNFDGAEQHFNNLLAANPSHPQAQEYLSQIASKRQELAASAPPPAPATDLPDLDDEMPVDVAGQPPADAGLPDLPAGSSDGGIAPPPAVAPPPTTPADDLADEPLIAPAKSKSRGPLIMIAVIGVLAVVGVGGFMGWKMFIKKEDPKPISTAPDNMEIPKPIDEKPQDPGPSDTTPDTAPDANPDAPANPDTPGPSSDLPVIELLDMAEAAIAEQDYAKAMEATKAVMDQDPLHETAREYYKEASESKKEKDALVKRYTEIRSKYLTGDADQALREAWTLYSPLNLENREPLIKYKLVDQVTDILRIGHYNKAVRFLKSSRPDSAGKELEALLTMGIDDALQKEISDLHAFCKAYESNFGASPEYTQAVDRLSEKSL